MIRILKRSVLMVLRTVANRGKHNINGYYWIFFQIWGILLLGYWPSSSWKRKFTVIQFQWGLTFPPMTACTVSTWAARWNSSTSPGRTWPTPGSNHTRSPCRRKKKLNITIEYGQSQRDVAKFHVHCCVLYTWPLVTNILNTYNQEILTILLYCHFGLLLSLLLTSYKSRIYHTAICLTGP
jgi:hypothetical protein